MSLKHSYSCYSYASAIGSVPRAIQCYMKTSSLVGGNMMFSSDWQTQSSVLVMTTFEKCNLEVEGCRYFNCVTLLRHRANASVRARTWPDATPCPSQLRRSRNEVSRTNGLQCDVSIYPLRLPPRGFSVQDVKKHVGESEESLKRFETSETLRMCLQERVAYLTSWTVTLKKA